MNTFASDRKFFSIFQNHLFGYYTVRLSKLSKEVFFLYALKDGLISLFYVTSFKTELKDNSDPENLMTVCYLKITRNVNLIGI